VTYRIVTIDGNDWIVAEQRAGFAVGIAVIDPPRRDIADKLVAEANGPARKPPNGYRQGRRDAHLARRWPRQGTAARAMLDYVALEETPVSGAQAGVALGLDPIRAGQMLGDLERSTLVERVPDSAPLAWRLSDHAAILRMTA
jgi:hypothetical protein